MSFWSAIFKGKGGKNVHQQTKAVGVLKDEEGWYYEESQNFSRSQSTIRIEQQRPGDWETQESSCAVMGLNCRGRREEVSRFFAGTYRWLRLEREVNGFQASNVIKVIGTYREKGGKENAAHLGFLKQELADDLQGKDLRALWGRIRFIRFPTPNRGSKYLIRFDLMRNERSLRTA
jgi:hypothetical protein